MKYINSIGHIDESQYYKTITPNVSSNGDFDSILEVETTIYATPESSKTQTDTSATLPATAPVTSSKELDDIFQRASKQYGVSVNLLKAVAKTESNFNPQSTSNAGAMGVMQLMPDTAAYLGVINPYDAEQNIMGGAKYLAELLHKYNNDISLSLAAYNAGPGNVDKYNGIPPFEETLNYVTKVMNYMNMSIDSVSHAVTQPDNESNITYIKAIPDSTATNSDSSIVTIYATAASDVTNSAKLYMI